MFGTGSESFVRLDVKSEGLDAVRAVRWGHLLLHGGGAEKEQDALSCFEEDMSLRLAAVEFEAEDLGVGNVLVPKYHNPTLTTERIRLEAKGYELRTINRVQQENRLSIIGTRCAPEPRRRHPEQHGFGLLQFGDVRPIPRHVFRVADGVHERAYHHNRGLHGRPQQPRKFPDNQADDHEDNMYQDSLRTSSDSHRARLLLHPGSQYES